MGSWRAWEKREARWTRLAKGASWRGMGMSSPPRLKESPALLVRALVLLGAVVAVVGAVAAYLSGRAAVSAEAAVELFPLVVVGAPPPRYGLPLPRPPFSSHLLPPIPPPLLHHA